MVFQRKYVQITPKTATICVGLLAMIGPILRADMDLHLVGPRKLEEDLSFVTNTRALISHPFRSSRERGRVQRCVPRVCPIIGQSATRGSTNQVTKRSA
jgi:hypothetical protein